jgi:6-phosphogluconolactonase
MNRFSSAAALDAALASSILATLAHSLQSQPRASIAFSGGSTPRGLFARLAASQFEWSRVDVFQVDERIAPSSLADSNQTMLTAVFLQGEAASASFHPLPARAAKLNLVHLGMGEDGHFASLFGAETPSGLEHDYPHALIHSRAPKPPHERLGLSLQEICRAERVVLQFVGRAKLEAFLEAEARGTPIAHLKRALGKRLEVFLAE